MDWKLSKLLKNNPHLQWASIANESGLLRTMPYLSTNILGPDKQDQGPFYVIANMENNPNRETVWTKPYVDYFGAGWVSSCTHPIDINGKMIGVVVLDVSIKTLQERFLGDFRLGNTGFAFIIEETGDIIYHPKYMPDDDHKWDLLMTNIFTDIKPDSEYLKAIRKMLKEKVGLTAYGGINHNMIAYASIEGQPWILGIEINTKDYIGQKKFETLNIIYFLGVLMILFIFITIFLYYQYSKPFLNLTKIAKRIEEGDYSLTEPIYNYAEIEVLSKALNSMCIRINDYTQSLIKKNNEIKSIFDSIMGLLMIVTPNFEISEMNNLGQKHFLIEDKFNTKQKCYELIGHSNCICKGCKINDVFINKRPSYSEVVIDNEIYNNSYYPIINKDKVEGVVVHSQNITEKILIEKEVLQSEKMAGIGLLSSAIAHELKNPLAIIKSAVFLMYQQKDVMENEVLKENTAIIEQAVAVSEKAVCSFLDFASPKRDSYIQVNVTKIIEQILMLSKSELIRRDIEVKIDFQPEQLYYYGEIELPKNIFLNILSNSIAAINFDGRITISGHYIIEECKKIEIAITDNGSGIDDKIIDKVFDPFFTTDTSGKGTGMGLWITKKLIERLSGKIILKSQKGIGTEFIIILPINSERGFEYEI